MKVAIIGAGVSGLSCAHELEKYGIRPVIYERNSYIGEQITHIASIIELTHRPIKDQLKYLHEKFDIDIKPINTINKLVHISPKKTATVHGNFGYFIYRGKEANDLKKQICAQLKNTEIRLNENVHYETLKGAYDYVLISSGESSMTKELGCWQTWFQGYERGATLLGSFEPNTQFMWINKDYCKGGYAYLAPFDSNKAFLTLVVPEVDEKEIDYFWEKFLATENMNHTLVEEFKLQHVAGIACPNKIDNIYFIGNAGGALDAFLGFGQFNAVVMGVMAARSIVNGDDYGELIKHIIRRNNQLYEFRKVFNGLSNENYDALITSIGLPGVKQLLYHTPVNVAKYGAVILKLKKNNTKALLRFTASTFKKRKW